MKTDPNRWNSLPGSFDALNTRQILYSDNEWGIPNMKKAPLSTVPEWLAPYRTRFRSKRMLDLSRGGYHFFIPDHSMKCVWERPQVAIKFMRKLPVVLSPNFSLARRERAGQLLAVYKNRWCGAWWQSQGLTVIASISWAGIESYEFCFAGVESDGIVAISAQNYRQYPAGFDEMVSRLSPAMILCLGDLPTGFAPSAQLLRAPQVRIYPDKWDVKNIL